MHGQFERKEGKTHSPIGTSQELRIKSLQRASLVWETAVRTREILATFSYLGYLGSTNAAELHVSWQATGITIGYLLFMITSASSRRS